MSKVTKQTIRMSLVCQESRTRVQFLTTWHLQSVG